MSLHPRMVFKRRETITDLPLYYSGCLQKKSSKEKDFKKFFGELRGTTLFLYKDDTQATYTDKMDLEKLKSMELENAFQKKVPPIFTLFLHSEEVQLKMDNLDAGMEWRGYILTVTKKEIPNKMQLLPGQKLQLEEVMAKERKRNNPTQRPPLPPRPAFLQSASPSPPPPKDEPDLTSSEMPVCFFNVSRSKAEQMLEENPECGSIILRPSALANNYALTLRQQKQSEGIMKNYRVTSTNSGFVIELDDPVTVFSLNDVVDYFLEKTAYRLQPYRAFQPYDTRIDVSYAPKCISTTSTHPKEVPKAQVAPMQRSETKEEFSPRQSEPEEGDYMVPDDSRPDDIKIVEMDGELRKALKLRRENIYAGNNEEEVVTSGNQTTKNASPRTATWSKNSSVV
ncbi:signal-transducing adaptor protein 1 [Labrus bergylta]|uniref:signal-transducing adaptor protein 1 n=1 Tax=Labrus bergylta TaxID=56723 RepID=UPI0009B3565A|nr:signal-transducing adaptor protein 1-like [Labrus bergylta]